MAHYYKMTFLSLLIIALFRPGGIEVLAQVPMPPASTRPVSFIGELEALSSPSTLPAYRDGTKMLQASSYDRTGWNDDGFSGRFSFVRRNPDSTLVLFDARGPGVINRIWTPTPTDDSLDFYIDDTTRPAFTIRYRDLFSGTVFPFVAPLCNNQLGGYYCYLPIPFQTRAMIVLRAKMTQFYQVGHRSFPKGTSVKPFSPQLSAAEKASLQQVQTFWNKERNSVSDFVKVSAAPVVRSSDFQLRPGDAHTILKLGQGGRIVGIELQPATAFEGLTKDIDIRITWDGENVPAVYCPVADLFGYAFGKASMQSLLIGTNGKTAYCYFPMPFDKSATIELIRRKTSTGSADPVTIRARVYHLPVGRNKAEGKFYTYWNHQPSVPDHQPHLLLNATGRGHIVGTALQARGLEPGMTGFFEGDDSTVADGEMTMHGTGSEDYFNGGWYAMMDRWDGPLSLPLSGALDYNLPLSRTGGYRLFLSDKISFSKSIHHSIEHGPEHNMAPGTYTSVVWYYCDTPPVAATSPASVDTKVSMPDTLNIYPQLLTINTFGDIGIRRQWAYNTGGESMIFTSSGEAAIRVRLDEVPDGSYTVFLDYARHPEGVSFSLWQRQTPLSDWKASDGRDTVRVAREPIGNITLTPLNHSLTLRFRGEGRKNQFFLNRITLVRSRKD